MYSCQIELFEIELFCIKMDLALNNDAPKQPYTMNEVNFMSKSITYESPN